MESLRLTFFGPFTVMDESGPLDIAYSPARWLLALLVSKSGRTLTRSEVATLLWPDATHEVAGNRLRVSLARLKEAVGDSILFTSKTELGILEGTIITDVDRAAELDRAAQFAADQAEEISLNSQLVGLIDSEFLLGWDFEWVTVARDHWQLVRREALTRISSVSLKSENWESAAYYAGQLLKDDEFDSAAWATFLRSSAQLGASDEAIVQFAKVRRRIKEEGLGDFPESLRDLARSVRDGHQVKPTSYPSLSTELSDALLNAIREVLASNPEAAVPLLLTEELKKLIFNFPEVVVDLLDETFDHTNGESDLRYALAEQVLRANSNLYRAPRSIEVARWILESNCDSTVKCMAASLGSFAHFVERDFESAFSWIDQAQALAVEIESPVRQGAALSQRASFNWHQGFYEEALRLYSESMKLYSDKSDIIATMNSLATKVNTGFVYYFIEDYKSSRVILEEAMAGARVLNFAPLTMMAGFYYGYDLHKLGDTATGLRQFHKSLTAAYRAGQNRNIQIGLDIAARFLSDFGHHSQALGLLEACERYRKEDRHTWSVAEMTVVNLIRESAGDAKPDQALARMTSPKEMVVATVSLFNRLIRT